MASSPCDCSPPASCNKCKNRQGNTTIVQLSPSTQSSTIVFNTPTTAAAAANPPGMIIFLSRDLA